MGAPVLVGAVLWAGAIYDKAQAHESRIAKIESHQENQTNLLIEIRERLVRIEERINHR